jgi:predicted outer membrane repeat protein
VTVELTIRDCVFDDNYAEETGGAVYCLNVQGLKVICCQFTGNGTYKWGGALCLPGRAVEMIDCRIQRNHSNAEAGGIWFSGQELTLRRCTFMENRASMYAGGMHIGTGERTVVRCFDCIWRDNAALAYRGGGIYIFGGITFEAARCRFIGNWTGKRGGAIANSAMNSLLRLSNCLLCGNRAGEGGAVFSNSHGAIHVMSCSAWANRAPKGAFLFDHTQDANYSSAEIRNCVVSNGESEIWNDRGAITVRYTDMPNGYAAVHDPRGLAVWGPGNIEADPCFVDSGYWDPNGTPDDPNDDFLVEGDYHLTSQAGRWDPINESWVTDEITSPCIDAGDPNSPIGQEPFPNGGRINMGAYGGTAEASKSYFGEPVCEIIMAGDINGDCRVDFRDLALVLEHWLWNGVQKQE